MRMTLEDKNIKIVVDTRSKLSHIELTPTDRPQESQVIEADHAELVVLYNMLHVLINSLDNRGLLP